MDKKTKKKFLSTKNKASEYLEDKEKTKALLEKAVQKAGKNENRLTHVWNDLQALFRLLKSWIKGEYKEVPTKTILLAITAVVYFVNPFDVIPDFLLAVGYIDDATIIGFVINAIVEDIKKFKVWESEKTEE